MKIIKQSFTPLKDEPDLVKQIGNRARICYQSEPKDNEEGFVNGIIKKGHNSCLEMGVIHLKFEHLSIEDTQALFESKYLEIFGYESCVYCTGSVRAWREFLITRTGYTLLTDSIKMYINTHLPKIFTQDLMESNLAPVSNMPHISEFDPNHLDKKTDTNISLLTKEHIFQAMRIVTNRAISHELVRHRPVSFLQESQRYVKYDKPGGIEFIEPSAFFEMGSTDGYTCWELACKSAENYYKNLINRGCTPQAARLVLPNSTKTELIMYCSLKQWEHILAMRHSKYADPSMQELAKDLFDWFVTNYPKYFTTQSSLERSVG